MSYGFGLTIESLVAILLLMTILYCARLNKQIGLLKADENSMKASVAELIMATEKAERAIGGLKLTASEADGTLGVRLRDAEKYCAAMSNHLRAGEDLLSRLRKIAYANKLLSNADGSAAPAECETDAELETPMHDAKTVAAAAQAFAERTRSRVHGRAA